MLDHIGYNFTIYPLVFIIILLFLSYSGNDADYLEEDIYELRIRRGRGNYRILYFFHGQNIAILAHGLVKEDVIPQADLTRAIKRKEAFLKDPEKHTYEENIAHV